MFSWQKIKRPILMLAPMAGYTDSAFRQIVKEIFPDVICFTEFMNISGLVRARLRRASASKANNLALPVVNRSELKHKGSMRQILFSREKERPIVVQIFGKKPQEFRQAAKLLADLGVDAIDINMGCPAKKIVSCDYGSALFKNPILAQEIVAAASEAASLPISVKMRIGVSGYDREHFLRFAENLERAGAKLITVHGRTAKQMYSGQADWQPIYELKKFVKIPVIGNGDIKSGEDAVSKIGNLDGIMVGRASMGNPWIFAEIFAAFSKKSYKPPSFKEKLPWIKKHIELSCEFKGEHYGIIEMRKHLVHYVKGLPNASELRQKLVTAESKQEVISIITGENIYR